MDLTEGRGCLTLNAVGLGALTAGVAVNGYGLGWIAAGFLFFGIGLGYVLLASVVVSICKVLRRFSDPQTDEWDADTSAMWGAFWPVSLIFWLLLTPFSASINRLFK